VKASTIVEWTLLRPDLWDPAPEDLLAWCVSVGWALLTDSVQTLVASNRPSLVGHDPKGSSYWWGSCADSKARLAPNRAHTTIVEMVFPAAMAWDGAEALGLLLDAAPDLFPCDAAS
jgi:hypothetical protein